MIGATHDPELDKQVDGIIDILAKAQGTNGFLTTTILIRKRNGEANAQPLREPTNFEMYNMGHLLTTACVHYRATAKTNLLSIARKVADFLDVAFKNPTEELAKNSIC